MVSDQLTSPSCGMPGLCSCIGQPCRGWRMSSWSLGSREERSQPGADKLRNPQPLTGSHGAHFPCPDASVPDLIHFLMLASSVSHQSSRSPRWKDDGWRSAIEMYAT